MTDPLRKAAEEVLEWLDKSRLGPYPEDLADALRAALAAQQEPLTEEEIMDAFHEARNAKLGSSTDNSKHRLSVVEIARAVERKHKIGVES